MPFPDVHAPMQPSDSLPPSATAPVPLADDLPRCGRLFCATVGPMTRAPADVSCVGDGSPALRSTGVCRGEARASQVLDRPLRTCSGRTPRRIPSPPRPDNSRRGLLLPSGNTGPLASGKTRGFGAAVPRPARSHAYASRAVFPRPAQGLLPAQAGSPLAGRDLHPLDDKRSFMKSSHPPIPFDQQGLVALYFLSVQKF
jgi:hypothetical protein